VARRRGYVLALDEGTTGTSACVFDAEGRLVGKGYQELAQHYPRPGWVEHDAAEIWRKTKRSARAALRSARIGATDVAAIGLTNQRETLVAWDARSGRPLARAIVWQDRRTAGLCEVLRRSGDEGWVAKRTGLRLDPYFSGTKLRWYVEHDRAVQRARRTGTLRFGTVDSWLLWNLTEGRVHGTDPSNASRTLLMDLRRVEYDAELLRLFRARREELPEILDSSGILGEARPEFLGRSVPVAGIAGDQQAALFGQACTRPGLAKNTYGTGCFALANTGTRAPQARGGLLATVAWRLGGRTHYALEGAVFIAGAVVQWLRDGLQIIRHARDTEALARSVDDTGGVVLVPAFVGLGAPRWDPYARGLLIGLTRGTSRAHVARAALESISFQSADVVDLLSVHGGHRVQRLRVDGGATGNRFLLQHQADVLGIPVERSAIPETTALGAAYLAGLGADLWSTTREVERLWSASGVFRPRSDASWRRRERAQWAEAVRRSLRWAAADPRSGGSAYHRRRVATRRGSRAR
jgi:glycerol kinase